MTLGSEGGLGAIFGLSETYNISKGQFSAITLRSNNHVICLPGCKIVRASTFDSGSTGVLTGGAAGAPIRNARWIGGELVGEQDPVTGEYPPGHVIRVIGDDILLEDVTINGFAAADQAGKLRGGIAMALMGDRIRVANPRIVNPFPTNGAGIRLFGGTGFRCRGGSVAAGGDAALQFCPGALDGASSSGITDGAYLDVTCSSYNGRMILVSTGAQPIAGVRFERISGEVTGTGASGQCIAVQNNDKVPGAPGGAISDVDFVDVRIQQGSRPAPAVAISNDFDGPDKRVAGIRFDGLWIVTPSDIAFCTFAKAAATAGEDGPIQDVSWVGGGVINPTGTNAPAVSLERLTGGRFAGLRLAGGTSRPTVILGNTIDPLAVPCCQRAAFEDVAITGVAAGELGLKADYALGCSWSRGSVAEADSAQPAEAAFRVNATARRFTVTGADTSGTVVAYRFEPGAGWAIRDGFGDRRRSAVTLGTPT